MKAAVPVTLAALVAILAGGCAHDPPTPKPASSASTAAKEPSVMIRTGELITYKNGEQIGRERWSDDGKALTSETELGGTKATVTIARSGRHVRVASGASGGSVVERDLPDGAIALENGNWQAFAIAAAVFPGAAAPTPVKVVIPSQDATIDGTIQVVQGTGSELGVWTVTVELRGLEVVAEVDQAGSVLRVRVPAQELEVRRAGEPAPSAVSHVRAPPESVKEEAIELLRDDVTLHGTLWVPRAATGEVPVALLIAGSGPTDRDGNGKAGLRTDAYRQLAEGLASRGIATLRFDKRGVGESTMKRGGSSVTIEDFANDAAAFLPVLRRRFSRVCVIGHSEGGLLALILPRPIGSGEKAPDAIVLVATAGRPLRAVLHEQLAAKVDAATLAEVDRLLGDLVAGRPLERVPAGLGMLFNPGIAPFLRSELEIDPVSRLRDLHVPITVVQGEADAQVSIEDAVLLGKARPGVKVVRLAGVNHVLKAEGSRSLPQGSYTDPSRPIVPAVVDAIAAGILPLRSRR